MTRQGLDGKVQIAVYFGGMRQALLPPRILELIHKATSDELVCDYSAIMGLATDDKPLLGLLMAHEDGRILAKVFSNRHDCEIYAHGLLEAAKVTFGDDGSKPPLDG